MSDAYIFEIPDLDRILNPEEVAGWKLFLVNTEKRYKKIHWQVTNAENCYTFQNIHSCNKFLTAVQLDFVNKRIVFIKGALDDGEFENFLEDIMKQLMIRVNPASTHFFIFPPKKKERK